MDSKPSGFQEFVANISFVKDRIPKQHAYLGVVGGFVVFFIALFFAWVEARLGINASDGGSNSGWAEHGFVAALPLLFILYCVIKDRSISVKTSIVLSVIALVLLLINNVVDRTVWVGTQYMGLYTPLGGKNLGSDLGTGFWIGLIAISSIVICGISWALHTGSDDN